ncbi:hypothetical protein Dsin_031618 [Dipteronia sinensis]|uniref:Uncharacterized protein n=1 Tax=Dipteronia sinensis TaxID=43782 RepID=A0AAD9ZLP9_9ROSI|nr:hypothetical protein Dsin_031618 [Dipteronia sinensis]
MQEAETGFAVNNCITITLSNSSPLALKDCDVFPDFKVSREKTEMQTISTPKKKKLHAGWDSTDVTIPEARGGRHQAESRQFEKKPSRWNVQLAQSNVDTEVEAANNGVPKGGKNVSAGFSSADKSKVLGSGSLLPSTGIAAHVIEQEVEIEV